jgi:hypothetical protein
MRLSSWTSPRRDRREQGVCPVREGHWAGIVWEDRWWAREGGGVLSWFVRGMYCQKPPLGYWLTSDNIFANSSQFLVSYDRRRHWVCEDTAEAILQTFQNSHFINRNNQTKFNPLWTLGNKRRCPWHGAESISNSNIWANSKSYAKHLYGPGWDVWWNKTRVKNLFHWGKENYIILKYLQISPALLIRPTRYILQIFFWCF